MLQPPATQPTGASTLDLVSTIGQYGLLGIIVVVLGWVVLTLWRSSKADADTARGERDKLREEREVLRAAHAAELNRERTEHARQLHEAEVRYLQDVARHRDGCNEERLSTVETYADRSDRLMERVATTTQALDKTMDKLQSHLLGRQGG